MADVFISYCHTQRERIALIKDKLDALKVSVWHDARLRTGNSFNDEIKRELDAARVILVCWDRDAKASSWVRGEATLARERGVLAQCLLDPVTLDPPFNVIQYENLSAWEGEDTFAAWLKLLERIGVLTERPGLAAYAQIIGEGGQTQRLRQWAEQFGDDPLADAAWERVKAIEGEGEQQRIDRERHEARERNRRRRTVRRIVARIRTASDPRRWIRRAGIGASFAGAAALGVSSFMWASAVIDREIGRRAFESRVADRYQLNRLAGQERRLRRAIDEVSGVVGPEVRVSRRHIRGAIAAAERYLQHDRQSYRDQQLMQAVAFSDHPDATTRTRAFLRSVLTLEALETEGTVTGSPVPQNMERLTEILVDLDHASTDPALSSLAELATIRANYYFGPLSTRCQTVIASLRRLPPDLRIGRAPLAQRAWCNRKLGRSSDALADYARILEASSSEVTTSATLDFAVRGFHGLGSTLIATADVPETNHNIAYAMTIAERHCQRRPPSRSSRRMQLAISCLHDAIRVRRIVGQTEFEVAGSRENLSFAYLRDGDIASAYANALAVEQITILDWNEVVRALTAERLRTEPAMRREATRVAREARRNISYYDVGDIHLCELQALMTSEHFAEAQHIIAQEHPGADVSCSTAGQLQSVQRAEPVR